MTLYQMLLVTIALPAAASDLMTMTLSNRMIVCCWFLGCFYQVSSSGISGLFRFLLGSILPILLLLALFSLRMLGPGDIKILSALGGLMGPSVILKCICCSFVIGAAYSAFLMVSTGMLLKRLRYLAEYIQYLTSHKTVIPYYRVGDFPENIHFTIPILAAVMLHIGGFYL